MKESSPIEETRKRAAIYTRFSTDLQNERSIEDQLSLCQSYAEREDLEVISAFEDRARSGGLVMGREGVLRMLDQAREKSFEALDRLSRDMEDLAGIHNRLFFFEIEIRAFTKVSLTPCWLAFAAWSDNCIVRIGQLYREDNAHKVRRGQAGQGQARFGGRWPDIRIRRGRRKKVANESSSRPRRK